MKGLPLEPPGQRGRGFLVRYAADFGADFGGVLEYTQLVYAFSEQQAESDFWKWFRENFGKTPARIIAIETTGKVPG